VIEHIFMCTYVHLLVHYVGVRHSSIHGHGTDKNRFSVINNYIYNLDTVRST